LGDAYQENQESERAIQAFTEGKVFNQKAGNTYLTLLSLGRLAGIYEVTGQLQQAYETCQQALKLAMGPNGQPTVAAAAAYLGLGKILRERNQLELSIQVLEKAVDLSKLAGTNGITVDASITLALALQGQGNWTAAHQWLDRAEEIMQGWYYAPAMLVRLGAFRARLWLAQARAQEAVREENISAASRWARQNNLELPQEIGESLEIEYLTVARLYLAQGRWSETIALLTSLLRRAKSENRFSRVIEILGLQALAFYMQGPAYKEQALAGFRQALDLAEPEGYVRIFADEGTPMKGLLRQAVSQGLALNYTNKLLAAFPDSGSDMTPLKNSEGDLLARNRESQNLVEPLSQREMELLRLVAAGLTNQEIAQELFLAVGTVKKHLNNIFGKLGASNRTQAIARARELQLL
jgi:LuxR family maltose regulon positive regulatory protein